MPGGTSCAVAVCKNDWSKGKISGKDLSFHRVPKEPNRRKKWIKRCRRQDEWNPSSSFVCSEHFLESDFERDFKSELLGTVRRRKLKPNAVPSVNLLPKNTASEPGNAQAETRRQARQTTSTSEATSVALSDHSYDISTIPQKIQKELAKNKIMIEALQNKLKEQNEQLKIKNRKIENLRGLVSKLIREKYANESEVKQ